MGDDELFQVPGPPLYCFDRGGLSTFDFHLGHQTFTLFATLHYHFLTSSIVQDSLHGHQMINLADTCRVHALCCDVARLLRDTGSIGPILAPVHIYCDTWQRGVSVRSLHPPGKASPFTESSSCQLDHPPSCPTVSSGVFTAELTLHPGLVGATLVSCLFRSSLVRTYGSYRRFSSEPNGRRFPRHWEASAAAAGCRCFETTFNW